MKRSIGCSFCCAAVLCILGVSLPHVAVRLLWYLSHAGPEQPRWKRRADLNEVRGKPSTPFITSERIDMLENGTFQHRLEDVWVTTYPKSGTTWTMNIVNLIQGFEPDLVLVHCPWPEAALGGPPLALSIGELNAWSDGAPNRCLKSHWTNSDYMADPQKRVIYVMRNVMDVAASFYHHTLNAPFIYDFDGSWDAFFELFANGDVDNGLWFDHIANWWPRRHDSNVLWLRYEDMKTDPVKAIRRIAAFLSVELSDDRVEKVLAQSSFKFMQEFEQSDIIVRTLMTLGVVRGHGARQGLVGGSKNYFKPAQVARLVEIYESKLKPLGVPRHWCILEPSD
eukprot:TRINITY_DN73707_c0_g1_i1.p1 TRINITY_DN73707_c0_g1~~TRINITY_DN73707_c0_g1_i1.p1  ORF type:complete len:350 (+),score=42.65 TRINITY_DN73707_c0_g1_i1:38-1051(+)